MKPYIVVSIVTLLSLSCATSSSRDVVEPITPEALLSHFARATDSLYCGGEPGDAAGFAALAELGVRTIISVDGARPDVEGAKEQGLGYVHIPIGYDGIREVNAASLVRALRDCPRPIYIHCHHGKHRGPAMTALAMRFDANATRAEAKAFMEGCGTSHEYAGLWRDVDRLSWENMDGLYPKLYEVAPVQALAEEMSAIDRIWDRLKLCREAGWQVPDGHPDLVPTQEALQLKERFQELPRTLEEPKPWLTEGAAASALLASRLEAALGGSDSAQGEAIFKELGDACIACHEAHRN